MSKVIILVGKDVDKNLKWQLKNIGAVLINNDVELLHKEMEEGDLFTLISNLVSEKVGIVGATVGGSVYLMEKPCECGGNGKCGNLK